jgi:hypothetical protein
MKRLSINFCFIFIFSLSHCYFNPIFRGTFFPNQEEENLEIITLASGLASSLNRNSEAGSLGEGSSPISEEPIVPSIVFSPTFYSFTRSFAIPAIRPTVAGIPFSNCTSSEPLIPGLLLNSGNCRITGTPTMQTEFGPLTFTITAINTWGSDNDTISIEISPPTGNDDSANFSITVNGLQIGDSFRFDDILGNEFTVSSNGSLTYDHPHLVDSQYLFSILSNPQGKICTIENSSGTVSKTNLPININCI